MECTRGKGSFSPNRVDIYTSDTSFHKKCKVEDIKFLCIKVIELFVDQLVHYRYKLYFSVPLLFGFMIK